MYYPGENCIIIVKGANNKLSFKHIQDCASQVIDKAKVAVFQLEINQEVTLQSLKLCKEKGCKLNYISKQTEMV